MNSIVVILPTYNEVENLPVLVPRLMGLKAEWLSVLIVDDDSPDGTGEVADELCTAHPGRVQVLHRIGRQRGLGAAYIDGFRRVLTDGADVVIGMDADLSHDPAYIPRMVDLISQYDLIVGSRYAPGGGVDGHWGWGRVFLSHGAQWYIRLMLGLKTKDATGAFRCYRRAALERLDFGSMRPTGFSFLIEVIYQAERLGFKVGETPIRFRDRERGQSKVSPRVIASALARVSEIRLRRGRYDQSLIERKRDSLSSVPSSR
jgi:dolichol-phosphate mannosyltransferase